MSFMYNGTISFKHLEIVAVIQDFSISEILSSLFFLNELDLSKDQVSNRSF